MPSSQNSIPLLRCPLNLSSLHAINVYRHTFLRMDHWLYKITITVRVHGERSHQYLDAISTVEETIHADFIAAQQALTDRQAALTRQLAERGLDATALTLSYRNPLSITVEIRTPNALRYIDLLQHLDRVCQTIDSAWFAGVLTVEEQLQNSRAAVQELTRLAGRVNTLVMGVAKRVLDDDGRDDEAATVREEPEDLADPVGQEEHGESLAAAVDIPRMLSGYGATADINDVGGWEVDEAQTQRLR